MLVNGDSLIGIVGAGGTARALALKAAAAGIRVMICNGRKSGGLGMFAKTAGSMVTVSTLAEAVLPEIVVLALPWSGLRAALSGIPDWEGRVVIDATNPPDNAGGEPADSGWRSSSEVVAGMVPGAHLVKAFNTLAPATLAADPRIASGRRVIFLAGDHKRAKADVARLATRMGYSALDLGDLATGGSMMQPPGGALALRNLVEFD